MTDRAEVTMTGTTTMTATTTEPAPVRKRIRRRRVASARLRILGWVVLLLAVAGSAALLLQRRVLIDELHAEVDRSLIQEMEEVRVLAAGRDPATGQPFGGNVAAVFDTFLRRNIPGEGETLLTFVDGEPYKATSGPYRLGRDRDLVRRWGNLTTTERGEISTPAGPVRYLAVPLADADRTRGVFVVANFLRQETDEIERAIRVGAAVYGAVLLAAAAVAWFVAGRVLAPVREVTHAAKEISETDLTRRISVPASNDEIAELARTFNAMLERLDTAFANQREFLDDAGHELRTPITVIRGHLEVEGDDPGERQATRAIVLDELSRMGRMVDDLLVLARAQQPDFLRRERVDLDLLTAELVAKAAALGDREWRRVATGHGVIVADRQRLTQAVMNLFDNAVRHTHPGSVIELGSALVDGEVHIWVHDDGPGVPRAEQERIFRRFARTHDGQRQAGTAGLGLAIVTTIAEAHAGRVELSSAPGQGATFTIVMPVAETE